MNYVFCAIGWSQEYSVAPLNNLVHVDNSNINIFFKHNHLGTVSRTQIWPSRGLNTNVMLIDHAFSIGRLICVWETCPYILE